MPFPEDRVLVVVVNRQRDLQCLRRDRWYRIPVERAPRSIECEYLAFFLSRSLGSTYGCIPLYARVCGVELVYRHWLLPHESDHPRANHLYYRVAVDTLCDKSPPVINPRRRTVAFIATRWHAFENAQQIDDLYLYGAG